LGGGGCSVGTVAAEGGALCGGKEFDVVLLAIAALVELGGVAFVLADGEFAPGKVEGVGMKVESVIKEEFEVVEEVWSGCILG